MAMMDHTWGLTSPIVSGVPVLYYLILIWLLTRVPVDHAARWNGVERHDQLTMPVYSANDE